MSSIKQEWQETCRTWDQVSCQQNVPCLYFFYRATCTDGPKLNAILSQVFLKAALRQATNALAKSFVRIFCVFQELLLCF